MKDIKLKVITPQSIFIDVDVEMVLIPGECGECGVLSGHESYVINLRPGKLLTYRNGKIVHTFITSFGVAEVLEDVCTILVDSISVQDDHTTLDVEHTETKLHEVKHHAVHITE
ncbi:F0F1 ATP synthase subunit epsilon [Rickettsiales endosymbiont of Peranema trichophorum]|uniref:FoF1 ATP synthase subunit delta/epsilon n=1 Tax=Rickettsiales endosymbiont of Peranema trichophorum TaxID=2486577 RepID=UPI001022A44F|nr:F0F1 ATP synthase subunit epsilon [Rickettsiales endosymbiont of Peranema trichophorum]RZI45552.1 F0F1 ATP synthase subunit epsilon [Rickettsiales endosymbiont of Peranema trichophorum]